MRSHSEISQILQAALDGGAEFAELFFEDREETNIPCVNDQIQGIKSLRIFGAGLHLLLGAESVYVYSNRTSCEALLQLAERGCEMLAEKKRGGRVQTLTEQFYRNPNPVVRYPAQVEQEKKIQVLRQTSLAARSASEQVRSCSVSYFDTDQRVVIANSEGLLTSDRRVTSRLRLQPTIADEKGSYTLWEDFTRPQGFEAFSDEEAYTGYAVELIRRMNGIRRAEAVSRPGLYPVVLAAGACGTLWHESCGHSLEATAIAHRSSDFCGKLGEMVASPKVTLVDDGTIPGMYGSAAVDDEGHPRQKNVLIQKGVLKNYLCDRYHGGLLGMESNGAGRRQNYTYEPVSRMSNTYLQAGEDEEEEMIRSVPEGLYVKSLGGGTGGAQFTLEVQEGFWIRNGQLDRQVKGLTLTGRGIDVIKKIDRVGKQQGFDAGGFCGASSGLVPVTSFQPMVRISEMAIG